MGNKESAPPPPPPPPIQNFDQKQGPPNDMDDMIETIGLLANPKNATKTPESMGKTLSLFARMLSKFSGKKGFGKRTNRKKHRKRRKSRTKSRTKK